ncbi:MAG TPA: hypothetical protein VMJ66_07990 [Geobacteraceae bacterium]|nr:hypothetical protein [Geobacteraceae bacterium]
MPKLPGNEHLQSSEGRRLYSLADINALEDAEKERIYRGLIPLRLYRLFCIDPHTFTGPDGVRKVHFIAPKGLGLLRIEIHLTESDADPLFFLDVADTHFRQMELSFCVISDPNSPRFNVDRDSAGRSNCFTTLGRNIQEELKAMAAGLFPHQTRRGLKMFSEFFALFERFVDSLGIEMILAEPLNYGNAIRYEKLGFDYITGKRLMLDINEGFLPDGILFRRLDGSTPFRRPGQERTVRGRSWAIHDGILDTPWDDVRIYKMIGEHAGINSFPEREEEEMTITP